MEQFRRAVREVMEEHRRRVEELRAARALTKELWDYELDRLDDELDRLLKARSDDKC